MTENAPGPDGHPEPIESPPEGEGGPGPDRGVPDSATRGPEGPELHDQVGHEGPFGAPAGDHGVPTDAVGAPPAVPESDQPVTGDLSGRPWPAGSYGPTRTDIPPNITEPGAPRGWDRAVDLSMEPGVVPDPAEVYVPEELRLAIEDAVAKYPDPRSAVIPALHAAQAVHGWCSPEAIYQVAATLQVTPAYLSSVASFYDQFNEEPVGRTQVYVCTGVACQPHKPQRVLDAIKEEARVQNLEDANIRHFECLGACDMAPMASIEGRYVGPLDPSDAPAIVAAIKDGEKALPGRGLEDSDYRLPWGGRA
jgi:NADH:ubiquinone oxidoreductase subunit E